ncbi:PEP-CTERM sorting domain-containing protein [Nodularia sp. UHCC 0506]|uniref:PEP-CTERM sorting domain-containing protein n=1 Tax=Nodularia sp. UHCC 0506 TaxID=3110243 RepID=UPI002B21D274|nr:PEP-CTERM sorting domain-containing protein [Nodularia sp. UHCC 0506]MEA5515001.1 PEP-CTERM sorting domain-containing protein [Nodularia sp. UHCC 0506]
MSSVNLLTKLSIATAGAAVIALGTGNMASAATIYWTDWISGTNTNGFTGNGTITTPTSTIDVTYNNPQNIDFFQPNGGIDYWQNERSGRNEATSPYTSESVDNIPTGTDIIALRWAGEQTLTFSENVANLVFSYISLNGNGYSFTQDFEILSFGNSSDGNSCGYWGCGTSFKEVIDLGNGDFEYRLLGTDEPHGTIRFAGAFRTISWSSLSSELWNGFTVGIEGTAEEIFGSVPVDGSRGEDLASVPEPTSLMGILGLGAFGVTSFRKRKQQGTVK